MAKQKATPETRLIAFVRARLGDRELALRRSPAQYMTPSVYLVGLDDLSDWRKIVDKYEQMVISEERGDPGVEATVHALASVVAVIVHRFHHHPDYQYAMSGWRS